MAIQNFITVLILGALACMHVVSCCEQQWIDEHLVLKNQMKEWVDKIAEERTNPNKNEKFINAMSAHLTNLARVYVTKMEGFYKEFENEKPCMITPDQKPTLKRQCLLNLTIAYNTPSLGFPTTKVMLDGKEIMFEWEMKWTNLFHRASDYSHCTKAIVVTGPVSYEETRKINRENRRHLAKLAELARRAKLEQKV
ncbi:hypothetical protein [Salmonella enterica]|uniref:hypothetical protein n=1 Tax=Salmonella enterica TaxID=28901 RepID=UPI0011BEEA7D|nr:hypothetical protein [Salmonella enterica]TXC16650.1 hypothetical protein DP148_26255 [Salmonella enterica subsp. enterica serovar Typhimurium]